MRRPTLENSPLLSGTQDKILFGGGPPSLTCRAQSKMLIRPLCASLSERGTLDTLAMSKYSGGQGMMSTTLHNSRLWGEQQAKWRAMKTKSWTLNCADQRKKEEKRRLVFKLPRTLLFKLITNVDPYFLFMAHGQLSCASRDVNCSTGIHVPQTTCGGVHARKNTIVSIHG